MSGIGKTSIGAAVAFVFASAMMTLAPTEASAQFNFGGMIHGFGHGGHGYRHRGGGGSHHRGHVSRHHRDDDSDTASSDKGKDKDALDENASNQGAKGGNTTWDNKLSRRPPSAASRDGQASDGPAAKPDRMSDDQPSFAPSR